jgi:Na+-translocating ferredoxin:NAD+ oxidoreductase RnfD subunit
VIRGRRYPIVLPKLSDPRLHLAAVIISLQVLGQVAFDFDLSIAQILIAIGTCFVLEVAITFRSHRVLMWPASAMLTGNGVAFVLRVPGTVHGDWWSLHGWWIYAATAAGSLLSKYVIRIRGQHIFNPSNIGLVVCFVALGPSRVEPLNFWWGPMSPWMVLALAIIVGGGLAILTRLHLLVIAVTFWVTFAVALGLLALTGHAMTATWHVGPVTGAYFWWVLVTSPEILVFLFFMITDPKTTPSSRRGRMVYAASIALLATLLIAPAKTEFWAKVAVLGSLTIVCAARPLLARAPAIRVAPRRLAAAAAVVLVGYTAAVAVAGIRARPEASVAPLASTGRLPQIAILTSHGVQTLLDRKSAGEIATDLVADLNLQANALSTRSPKELARAAIGDELTQLTRQVHAASGGTIDVPASRLERMRVWLEAGHGQGPAIAVVSFDGTRQLTAYRDVPPVVVRRAPAVGFQETLELQWDRGRWLVAHVRRGRPIPVVATPLNVESPALQRAAAAGFAGVRLKDVAKQVGLDFQQGSFRFGVTNDPTAMMGGGLCWLDYDNDGWLDLFVVNGYSESNVGAWDRHGGLPHSELFHNVHGHFVNVTAKAGAGLAVRGQGCVAADLNGDGRTDLYVTTASGGDKLMWNNGDGTFTEGAGPAGVAASGWHTGAAVGDVNGDGRLDLFVAGYTKPNAPIRGSLSGYPTNHLGERDLLYLNEGNGPDGRARFREVGRLDLYVANDGDPNRYYVNVRAPGLGFRFVDRARSSGLADPNSGFGIAAADYTGDGWPDLLVSNSRGQGNAAFRSREGRFKSGQPAFAPSLGTDSTGWGATWVDLNNDGNLDLALANGTIPVTSLTRDAGPVQVLENVHGTFAKASDLVGLGGSPRVNGRGIAAADFDNDGHTDLAINSVGGRLVLLRGSGGSGHWLEVRLPRVVPGSIVTAVLPNGHLLVRSVLAGSSYLSSEDPRVHFGLGDATSVRQLIVWYPGGHTTRLTNVRADRIVSVR